MFSFFKKKKKENLPTKPREFKFSTLEAAKIGDKYEYTVKADTEAEAFDKLVRWFFEKDSSINSDDIKQQHFDVTYPYDFVFKVENMPYWFGKRISGYVKEDNRDYQLKLIAYARKNNIILNNQHHD